MDDLVRELGALGIQAVTPLCPVTEASGADLTAMVLDQSRAVLAASWEQAGGDRVLPEQVDLIGAHVAALRRLDDPADRVANVIGMLSYVSAFAGHGAQAVHLAEAAHC